MAWFRPPTAVDTMQPLAQDNQQRLRKRCSQYLKSLQSCRLANVADNKPCARLETRVLECYAEVIVPERAMQFKECCVSLTQEHSSTYAAEHCQPYVSAMRDALQKRHCNPL